MKNPIKRIEALEREIFPKKEDIERKRDFYSSICWLSMWVDDPLKTRVEKLENKIYKLEKYLKIEIKKVSEKEEYKLIKNYDKNNKVIRKEN